MCVQSARQETARCIFCPGCLTLSQSCPLRSRSEESVSPLRLRQARSVLCPNSLTLDVPDHDLQLRQPDFLRQTQKNHTRQGLRECFSRFEVVAQLKASFKDWKGCPVVRKVGIDP